MRLTPFFTLHPEGLWCKLLQSDRPPFSDAATMKGRVYMTDKNIPFRPAEILLPASGVPRETWACIACDQYTSQPEYWEKTEKIVGENPSTLRLMLPECWLGSSRERIPGIHGAMEAYLREGVVQTAVNCGFVLCRRRTPAGERLGLVGTVDLEEYDYAPGSKPLVRPTEQTIVDRLPPRLEIRRGAALELTHILILIDDPDRTVVEPLAERAEALRKLYDFELMQDGGHLTGYAVEKEADLKGVEKALSALKEKQGEDALLMAVGDGNHSLATAKAYWEEIRGTLSEKERKTHPARFALCEIENIHDPALEFEPIHRLITGTTPEELYDGWERYAAERGMILAEEGEGHTFEMAIRKDEYPVVVKNPEGAIPCETIQLFLDEYLRTHPGVNIDYIHGEQNLRKLAEKKDAVGFLLPRMEKGEFFETVRRLGVLPRKTFSMGEADEKRFYMECKKI